MILIVHKSRPWPLRFWRRRTTRALRYAVERRRSGNATGGRSFRRGGISSFKDVCRSRCRRRWYDARDATAAYRQQAERLERDQPERDCSRLLVAAPRSGTMGPAGLTHAIQSNALRCHSTVADRPNNRSRTGLCPLLGQTRNHLLGSSLCGAIRPVQQVQRRVDFSQLVLDFLIVRAWTPV